MKQRDIRVWAVPRDPPDYKQLARALLKLAAEILAEQERQETNPSLPKKKTSDSSSNVS
jgi:hypothetical protein